MVTEAGRPTCGAVKNWTRVYCCSLLLWKKAIFIWAELNKKKSKSPTVVQVCLRSTFAFTICHLLTGWRIVCLKEGEKTTNLYWQNIKRDVECDICNYGDETLVTFQRWTLARQQMGEPVCWLDAQESQTATFKTSRVPLQKNVTLVPEFDDKSLQMHESHFCPFIEVTLVSCCFIWKAWTCCLLTFVHLDSRKKKKRHKSNAAMCNKEEFSPLCFQPKAALHIPPFFPTVCGIIQLEHISTDL